MSLCVSISQMNATNVTFHPLIYASCGETFVSNLTTTWQSLCHYLGTLLTPYSCHRNYLMTTCRVYLWSLPCGESVLQ